jgi:hypothetical protein
MFNTYENEDYTTISNPFSPYSIIYDLIINFDKEAISVDNLITVWVKLGKFWTSYKLLGNSYLASFKLSTENIHLFPYR